MAMVKAKHPRNIQSSYYKPIGQIIARWMYSELYMSSIAWHVLKIKNIKIGRLLTWGYNPVDKVKLFASIADPRWIADSIVRLEIDKLQAEAHRLRTNRNKLAHGLWAYLPNRRTEYRLFYLRDNNVKIDPKTIKINLAELKQWAADFDALNVKLKNLHKRLGAPVP
jgi:hypothetical protein